MDKNNGGLLEAAEELVKALDDRMCMNDYGGLSVSKHDEDAVTEAVEKLRAELLRAPADTQPVLPQPMKEYDGYVPAEDGEAGDYYVNGWNDCLEEVRKALAHPAPEAAQPLSFAEGVKAAVKWVEKRRDDYIDEFGYNDPDTGALEFGTGSHAEAKREYVGELEEIVEGLNAILTRASAESVAEPSKCPECDGSGIGTFAGDPCHVCNISQRGKSEALANKIRDEISLVFTDSETTLSDGAKRALYSVNEMAVRLVAAQQQAEPKHATAKAGQHCVNCGLTLGQQTSWCNCEANRAVEAQQVEPVGDERQLPRVYGVSRSINNSHSVLVLLADVPSDDDLLEIRERLNAQSGQRAGVADWIDAAVQNPPDATPVLVSGFEYNDPHYARYYDVCRFEDGAWVSDVTSDMVYTPTHWMTIAAAPTPAAQGGV